jgi:hypothetical protein
MNIDYYSQVKIMLSNYKALEIEQRIFGMQDDEHSFLNHCISCLESYEKDLVVNVLIEKVSIRRYSRKTGFSRNFIAKERDRIISLLGKFFMIKYSYEEEKLVS